jgi:hypothetical protein
MSPLKPQLFRGEMWSMTFVFGWSSTIPIRARQWSWPASEPTSQGACEAPFEFDAIFLRSAAKAGNVRHS